MRIAAALRWPTMPARLATDTPCIVTGIKIAMNNNAASTSASVKAREFLRRWKSVRIVANFVAEVVGGLNQRERAFRALANGDLRDARPVEKSVRRKTDERHSVSFDPQPFVFVLGH